MTPARRALHHAVAPELYDRLARVFARAAIDAYVAWQIDQPGVDKEIATEPGPDVEDA